MNPKKNKEIDISKKVTYGQALLLPFRVTPVITVLGILNALFKIGLVSFGVLATAHFIDSAIAALQGSAAADWKAAILWLCGILFIKLYSYVDEPLWNWIGRLQQEKRWRRIDYPAMKLQATIDLQHFEDSDTADLISRTATPGGALCGMQDHLLHFLVFVGGILSYVVILLWNAPLAGCVILVAAVPMVLIARKSALAQYKMKQDVTEMTRRESTLRGYIEGRDTVAERKLFSFFNFVNDKFKEVYFKTRKFVLQAEVEWSIRKSVAGVALTLLCALSIFALLPAVSKGALAVGMFISLVQSIFRGAEDIAYHLSPYLETFYTDSQFLKEYEAYTELSRTPDALVPLSDTVCPFASLVFDHVSFAYPGTETLILKDVSFTLTAGKHYALVGLNGSGKSTIIKLILKFYDNYTGNILLNGRSLREWPLSDIKGMMSAVFQDFCQYDISIRDNISIGSGFTSSTEEIEEAIRVTGLDRFVAQLPDGIDTALGKIYDDGVDLSGGQWQKIAIARIMVSHSSLRIFDEPTASLDPISERDLYGYFDSLSKDVTAITISHRLASCLHADEILLLDDGVILEQGSHTELMAINGKYKEMFESQRSWYI